MLTKADLLGLHGQMWTMRFFEERLTALSRDGVLRGSLHLATGQEAIPAGSCAALNKEDWITVTYRGHGYVLAKGADMGRMLAEILGRQGGLCKGKGGKMHLVDKSCGVLGANGIVGAGIPIAAGAALNAKLQASGRVAMTVFGDGALNQGVVHETLNMAALWKLPMIFLCENNLYAEMTPISRSTPVVELCDRMAAYSIPAMKIDGNDPVEVYKTVKAAADRARAGNGPTFIEAMTYRTCGHYQADAETYRTKEEVAEWEAKSPLIRFEAYLMKKFSKSELAASREHALQSVESATKFALASSPPNVDERLKDVFA